MIEKIRDLIDEMNDEVESAEKYAKQAVAAREAEDKEAYDSYMAMCKQEVDHANALYNNGQKMVSKWKSESPEDFKAVDWAWKWNHQKMTDRIARVKGMFDQTTQNFR